MAWGADVKALKTPVLIITGDADGTTLEHSVSMFRLLGGGDMGKPLAASRLAVLPATSHTAVITQPDLLIAYIEPFPEGRDAEGHVRVGHARAAWQGRLQARLRAASAFRWNSPM